MLPQSKGLRQQVYIELYSAHKSRFGKEGLEVEV